jgi:hypothetical protein
VAFLANGSHAAYFRPGVRDRTFPDPNDEADGRGRIRRPRLVPINARSPGWMRFSGRWGASRARLPFESEGRCYERGECNGAGLALSGAVGGLFGLLGLAGVWLRRRTASPGT